MNIVEEYFPKSPPFNGEPRENQGECIQQVYDAITAGKRFIVIAAPTGAGKSAILYAVAKATNSLDQIQHSFDGSYSIFTTSQKLLQDQYEADFNDMFVLKGRNNYQCFTPVEEGGGCDSGTCLYKKEKPECSNRCPYTLAKKKAIGSSLVVTNLAYFIGESNNVNAFGKRRMLVIDEAHTIENGLMSYIECVISQQILKFCDINMVVPMLEHFTDYTEFLERLRVSAMKKAGEIDLEMQKDPGLVFQSEKKKYDRLVSLANKIAFINFHRDTCKWIADTDKDKKKVVFKPINVASFAHSHVFAYADIVVLSSATITRAYVKNCLGIKDFEYIEVPSTFPVENRPIFAMNCGKMGFRFIDQTLPKTIGRIDSILDEFHNKKGIIHATSYKIARYIQEHSKHGNRLISHNSVDRMEKLTEHMETDEPTVLLSPSMTEGVDLKGDLSAFQIIVKIPYASLGDKQIKARMEDDKIWYANLAAVQLMQAYGRSVRSKDDVAITFVLDSGFKWFIKGHRSLFCNWFLEAIR